MKKTKSVLLIVISLLLLMSNSLFAEEINIKISGEEYTREMPTDIEQAQILIRYLVKIINNADDEINLLNEKSAEERKEYVKKLEDISTKLNETTKKLEETEKTIEQVDRDTTKMTKMNTRCTSFAIVGPSVDFNKIVGLSFILGFDYRILRNIHIGATLNSSLFTDTKLNGDVGVGLLFGYSIY